MEMNKNGAGSDKKRAVERLINIWPSIQMISQGHRCHCGQARQFWFTLDNRLLMIVHEDRIDGGCWCPVCGFSNACGAPLLEFFDRLLWVNPERLQTP